MDIVISESAHVWRRALVLALAMMLVGATTLWAQDVR